MCSVTALRNWMPWRCAAAVNAWRCAVLPSFSPMPDTTWSSRSPNSSGKLLLSGRSSAFLPFSCSTSARALVWAAMYWFIASLTRSALASDCMSVAMRDATPPADTSA